MDVLLVLPVFLLGCGLGVVTGLLPGLHPNAVIFLLLAAYLSFQPPLFVFAGFVVGVGVVHTFVSFIPSILLSAPGADTALSAVPGHRFVQQGRGLEAILCTVYGGVVATIIVLLALPVLFSAVPVMYGTIQPYMHVILMGVVALMILREPCVNQKRNATTIILLSGILGVLVLQSPVANTTYILSPVFAGLFGLPTILVSLQHTAELPPQRNNLPVSLRSTTAGGAYGFLAGMLAGFLPGIGTSQSALVVDELVDIDRQQFVTALGGITTADLFISLIALYVIGNPRSGAAVALQHVAPDVTMQLVVLVVGLSMIAVGIGALATRFLAGRAIALLTIVPYHHVLWLVTLVIVGGTYVLTGWFGLLVLVTSTALGILCIAWNVRRSYCMAVLIVPTVLHYAGVSLSLF